jgi:hypothetical protein
MISSFTVGSIFKIVDEASPALRLILKQVRELNTALDRARASLTSLGKPIGLAGAVGETSALAKAWGDVAKNAGLAQRAIGSASTVAARTALPPAAAAVTTGEARAAAGLPPRGRAPSRPGWHSGGGGGAHFGGPSLPMPGGGHVRGRGGAMAGAGLLGYGVYEAAEMEDAVFQLIYHSGLEQNDANRAKFRKILQNSMVESGYPLKEIAESAKQEIRMFQGTPGGGLDVLPEMLRASTTEARLKGSTPQESMRALIGLAHMTKQYSPEAIKKLAPAFAFLSTANPSSLSSMERAAGYAVPLLQSGLEIDPMDTLLLGTALTRAGVTNTKSGTWIREMAVRALPGTSLISSMAARRHNAGLKAFGLLDEKNQPTWYNDDGSGRLDIFKMMRIAREHAAAMTPAQRTANERAVFGAQGSGAFSILSDPAVTEQIENLRKTRDSPEFKNRYGGFMEDYRAGSTAQAARTAIQDFNVTMMDIGRNVLPSVNIALHDFKGVLEGIRSVLPSGSTATVGARAAEGALIGGIAGSIFPGLGTVGGAVIGGAIGGVEGVAEQYMKNQQEQDRKAGGRLEQMWAPRLRLGGAPDAAPQKATLQPLVLNLNLNVDGRTLAESVSTSLATLNALPTQAPAADGMGQFYGGDHNYPDK